MSTFAVGRVSHTGRVVYRGYNNANANGGVSNANANNDASNSDANRGSRLDNKQSAYNIGDVFPTVVPREASHSNSAKVRKAEKSSVGWSLVGSCQLEEVRPGERKALIFYKQSEKDSYAQRRIYHGGGDGLRQYVGGV